MLTDARISMIQQLKGTTQMSIQFIKDYDREWDAAVARLRNSRYDLGRITLVEKNIQSTRKRGYDMDGTKNYTDRDLYCMQQSPSPKSTETGNRLPYHLQYIRDGKVNVKPEVKYGQSERDV